MTSPPEIRFSWPDPLKPIIVTRDLVLACAKKVRVALKGIKLIVLVPGALYEVAVQEGDLYSDIKGLQPGCILSRNRKLSYGSSELNVPEENQVFVSYDGVFKARRGIGRVDRRGRAREIPAMHAWTGSLEQMITASWELKSEDEEGQQAYTFVALQATEPHVAVVDENKRHALASTLQSANVQDTRGRFNPGRLPLAIASGQDALYRRMQNVRGIGRHMSFREVVLEHYLDAYARLMTDIKMSQQYRLRPEWLAQESGRTSRQARHEGARLVEVAHQLRTFHARPFSRTFVHAADDLEAAGVLLKEAAAALDPVRVKQAKELIGKTYRSMRVRELHRREEDVLQQLRVCLDRKESVEWRERDRWWKELQDVATELVATDTITRVKLGQNFVRDPTRHMIVHTHLSCEALARKKAEGGPNLQVMYAELRRACAGV